MNLHTYSEKQSYNQSGEQEGGVCLHCGGECCGGRTKTDTDARFCCEGCRAVYMALHDTEVCDVSQGVHSNPRKSQTHSRDKYAYLDDETVVSSLLTFQDETMANVVFTIPSISCMSCVKVLEQLYASNQGIIRSEVNFPRKEVNITFSSSVLTLRDVVELLVATGYEPEITLKTVQENAIEEESTSVRERRSLYLKTGIAGFAFANIMLLSAPAYLTEISVDGAVLDPKLQSLFTWLSIALSLPVLLYSASDYFIQSYRSFVQRKFSLEIPVMLGIVALFVRSIVEILQKSGTGYLDSFTGLVFFLLIAKVIQTKSFESLRFDREFSSLFPLSITTLQYNEERTVAISSLKKGDVLRIHNGELIPADSLLISGFARIDNSFITGESEPCELLAGAKVFAGARLVGATASFSVINDVSNSHLHRLWSSVEAKKRNNPILIRISEVFAQYFTLVVTLLAIGTALWWYPHTTMMLNAATAVLIVACPCALTLATPFALGAAMNALARVDYYCKRNDVIFDLARTNTAVFDKTGTLMESTSQSVVWNGETLSEIQFHMLYSLSCSSSHPLSRAIARYCKEHGAVMMGDDIHVEEFAGEGVAMLVDSANILLGSKKFLMRNGIGVEGADRKASSVFVAWNGKCLGAFTISHVLRNGTDVMLDAIQQASGANIEVHCISGDADKDRKLMMNHIPQSNLHFGMSPQEKAEYITALQTQGSVVAMIGDGVNDTGALRAAHVGIAVSDTTASFTPASDIIVAASSLRRFHAAIAFARATVWILIGAFALSIIYNVIGMWLAMTGTLTPMVAALFMPISSWSVVGLAYGIVRWRGIQLRKER